MNRLTAPLLGLLLASLPAVAEDSAEQPVHPSAAQAMPATDASAEPGAQVAAAAPLSYFESLMVVGGPDRVAEIPGSAAFLDADELEQQDYSDVSRILRLVPGVTVVEEEGYGLRPNIGMRGTGTERSSKITLLEDGILIAPAPYSAPAAYYFPTPGRMEAIEVRKGSTAIAQGPFTTGGALNLISTSIPFRFGGAVEAEGGSDATFRMHATAGGTEGRFGWLIETYQLQSDGFKQLDGGGDTGFELRDYMAKVRWGTDSSAPVQQLVELKLGYTEQFGDETYLGLSESDYRENPYRRYRASAADDIQTEHEQIQLRHFVAPAAWFDVTTSIYRNDFFRNWHKLSSVAGTSIGAILDDPQAHPSAFAIVRGETDANAALKIRNNRRDYYGRGIQSVAAFRTDFGGARHAIEVGARFHEDAEDRFQEDERWSMIGGSMVFVDAAAPGSNANRISSAEAVALFVQDEIAFGRWSVTPGIRFETIDFTREDYGKNDPERSGAQLSVRTNSVDAWIPGVGVSWRASDTISLFGGLHKGFAPPGPGANRVTEPEESLNWEAGVRRVDAAATTQLVAFFSDYDNLLGKDTLSSGGTGSGDLFNGGEVDVWGLEASLDRDLAPLFGADASVPFRLAYTWTESEFQTSFETSFADWAPRVDKGDELPYLPPHQLSATIGWAVPKGAVYMSAAWLDAMRTTAGSGEFEPGTGTEAATIVDATAKYAVLSRLDLVVRARNLFDETYIAARRPAGLRPGLPRSLSIGLDWRF